MGILLTLDATEAPVRGQEIDATNVHNILYILGSLVFICAYMQTLRKFAEKYSQKPTSKHCREKNDSKINRILIDKFFLQKHLQYKNWRHDDADVKVRKLEKMGG